VVSWAVKGYQHFRGPWCLHLQNEWRWQGPPDHWYPTI